MQTWRLANTNTYTDKYKYKIKVLVLNRSGLQEASSFLNRSGARIRSGLQEKCSGAGAETCRYKQIQIQNTSSGANYICCNRIVLVKEESFWCKIGLVQEESVLVVVQRLADRLSHGTVPRPYLPPRSHSKTLVQKYKCKYKYKPNANTNTN